MLYFGTQAVMIEMLTVLQSFYDVRALNKVIVRMSSRNNIEN